MKKLLVANFIFILYTSLMAQTSTIPPMGEWLDFNHIPHKKNLSKQDLKKALNLDEDNGLIEIRKRSDAKGIEHIKNQQVYKGIPIEGAILIAHKKNSILKTVNGHLVRNLSLNTQPNISPQTALNLALNHIDAEKYAWEIEEIENYLKISKEDPSASFLPESKLTIFAPDFDASKARLAYSFDIFSISPLRKVRILLDAQVGNILFEADLIHHGDVSGSGKTEFNGTKEITCDHDIFNNKYSLKDNTRNIETRNGSQGEGFLPLSNQLGEPCENNSSDWADKDPIALGVHWASEQWYDFMKSEFQWDGYDGLGSKIMNIVHFGDEMNGAFWTGNWASYGDGHGDYNSWTSLDMVAHEINHGLIEHTANLIYHGESGALNESFADIFAVLLERNVLGDSDNQWIIGEDITKNGEGLRNMATDDIMYHGTGWHYSQSDHGGVHTNSRVQNRWFYLLSQEIGIENAAQICFYSLSNYLTPYSNYQDARNASIAAASILFPENTQIQSAICTAWESVGVYGNCTELETINITLSETTILTINNPIDITWTNSENISHVNIEYAIDNENLDWQPIASYLETASTNNYTWNIPELDISAFIIIRISDASNYSVQESTEPLSMQSCPTTATFQGDNFHTCMGTPLSFTNSSIGANHYEWYLNGILFSTYTNLTWTTDVAGESTIELRAYHENGCYSSHSEELYISSSNTDAALFSYQISGNNLYPSIDNPNPYANYTWDFGDGKRSTELEIVHSYEEEGIYSICLEVENDCNSIQFCDEVVIWSSNGGGGFCEPKWTQHIDSEDTRALLETTNSMWVGTYGGGLIRQSKIDGSTDFFNNANSDLPDNRIVSLEEDGFGNIWIGTHNQGVVKFDGTNWYTFDTSNSDLPHNHIRALLWNPDDNNIWIGTNGGGIAKFDGTTNWEIYKNSNTGLPSNRITALMKDSDDNIWIGTYATGLVKFDGTDWEVSNTTNSGLPNNRVTTLLEDDLGNIWIGTYIQGVVKYDGTNWEVYNISNVGLVNNRITSLTKSTTGAIWISTYTGGVVKYDGGWQVYNDSNSEIPTNRVYTVLEDEYGSLWTGTADGLSKLNGTSWESVGIPYSGLLKNQVTTLLEAEDHSIWIGISELGIVRLDSVGWDTFDLSNSDLPDNRVYTLLEDQAFNIWVGTGVGFSKFDGTSWTTFNTSNSDLPHNHVRTSLEDSAGNIWAGTDGGGLSKFNGTNWITYNTSNSNIPYDHIRALLEDSNGNIWAGTEGGGFAKFDGTSWIVQDIGVPSDSVRAFLEDSDGNIWVGTEGSGLAKFDGTDWTLPSTGISNNIIRSLLEDSAGNIWVGTNGDGLVKYDGIRWESFNVSNSGLPNNLVVGLFEDHEGGIWAGTYVGVGILHNNVSFESNVSCSQNISYFQNKSYKTISNEWRIDGETVSYDIDLSYEFESSGIYEVALIATNEDGCIDIHRESIEVPAAVSELDAILPEYISICEADSVIIDLSEHGYVSHEWTNNSGTIVSYTPTLTATTLETIYLTVVDSCGGIASDSISILLGSDCVWPGDTNLDRVVNHLDLLAVGMAFGSTGQARLGANENWLGQVSADWDVTYGRDEINTKHVDANGDGKINEEDIDVILSNYGKSIEGGQAVILSPIGNSPYSLAVEFEMLNTNTREIQLSLKIESNNGSTPLAYGLATKLLYDSPSDFDTLPRPLSPQHDVIGSDVISINHQFSKQTDIAFVGTNRQNRNFLSTSEATTEANEEGTMVVCVIGDERELAGGSSLPYLRVMPDEILMINYTGDAIPIKGEQLDIFLPDEDLSIVITSRPVACNNPGNATIHPVDVNQSYSYLWETNETTPTISTMNTGIHKVTVTNGLGIESYYAIDIQGVEGVNIEIEDGESTLNTNVDGGEGNYLYLWNTGETTSSIAKTNIAHYSVTVTDENDCTASSSIVSSPVSPVSLEGVITEGISYLEWTNIHKENNDYFIIEYSTDNVSFSSLDEMEINESTISTEPYLFNHQYPRTGNNYYRIKLVNKDGTEEFSNTLHLVFLGESKLGLQSIYPVPATEDIVSLEYVATEASILDIEIIDIQGRIISLQQQSLEEGINQLEIDIKEIIAGMYVLRFKEGNNVKSYKLPIVK